MSDIYKLLVEDILAFVLLQTCGSTELIDLFGLVAHDHGSFPYVFLS